MGNFHSNNISKKEFSHFYEIIDFIATDYILTMNFNSLKKLSEKDYCDNLIVITSDIVNRYFNDIEITYLEQRIKKGEIVNELSKEKINFVNKDKLDEELDIKNDTMKTIKKKRVCIGISKFYVKIAHIFAAIVTTINPVYKYIDDTGNMVTVNLLEKDKIPKNVSKKLYKLNICDNRINSLYSFEEKKENKTVTMYPKLCELNIDEKDDELSLDKEPGISELMNLYLDDYDYSNGTFTGMTDKTKMQFNRDLKTFYTTFTGNNNMPPEIKKFSDIKLRTYNKSVGCKENTPQGGPVFKQSYNVSHDMLFEKYAENIKNMINNASNNQAKLLSIINELFVFIPNPQDDTKKQIRVNPLLTDEKLQILLVKTRNIIIELYIRCEKDYVHGIKLYEAIVEKKILETTINQIDNLEQKSKEIIYDINKQSSTSRVTHVL